MQFIGILRHGWNQNRKSETRSQEYYIGFLERSALGDSENEKHIDFITRDGIGRSRKSLLGLLNAIDSKNIKLICSL